MANRYWVGGAGTWDGTSTTHWSATSGGAGGASVPTSADDVYFNASSGGGNITTSGSPTCKNFDTTGFSGDFYNSNLTWNIYGTSFIYTLGSNLGGTLKFWNVGTVTITGAKGTNLITASAGTTLSFSGAINFSGNFTLGGGGAVTFEGNSATFYVGGTFTSSNASNILNLGSAVIKCLNFTNTVGSTVNAGTSTINIYRYADGGTSGTFAGGGKTYYKLKNENQALIITGANTFSILELNPVSATTDVTFPSGVTQTVASIVSNGTAGNLVEIMSSTAGTAYTLTYPSGTISCDYIAIMDSNVTGGATWNAGLNSINYGHNIGWSQITIELDRYWVGGTNTWNTSRSNWSTSSGGTSGAPAPTRYNNVYLDTNSGNGTITISSSSSCKDFDSTGFAGTTYSSSNGVQIYVYGNLVLGSSSTLINHGFAFVSPNLGSTITTNGKIIQGLIYFLPDGSYILQDDFTQTHTTGFVFFKGILYTNGYTFNVYRVSYNGSLGTSTRGLDLSSSTVNATVVDLVPAGSGVAYFNAGTSTINIANGGTLSGNGMTFNDVVLNGTISVSGNNTYNSLTHLAGSTITYSSSSIHTVTNFVSNGVLGNLVTILSSSAGSPFTLSKSSGTVALSYISVKDSTATGGATWRGDLTCVDAGGNTGWFIQKIVRMVAGQGAFTVLGKSLSFIWHKVLRFIAGLGTFNLTGKVARIGRILRKPFAYGSFIFTGMDIRSRNVNVMIANVVNFAVIGKNVLLHRYRKIAMAKANFTLTMYNQYFAKGRKMVVTVATFTVTGKTALLKKIKKMVSVVGAYALNGQSAILFKGRKLTARVGTFFVDYQDFIAVKRLYLRITNNLYNLTGKTVQLHKIKNMIMGFASFTYSAGLNYFHRHVKLVSAVGRYALNGQITILRKVRRAFFGYGSYVLTGSATLFHRVINMVFRFASYAFTGFKVEVSTHGDFLWVKQPKSREDEWTIINKSEDEGWDIKSRN